LKKNTAAKVPTPVESEDSLPDQDMVDDDMSLGDAEQGEDQMMEESSE